MHRIWFILDRKKGARNCLYSLYCNCHQKWNFHHSRSAIKSSVVSQTKKSLESMGKGFRRKEGRNVSYSLKKLSFQTEKKIAKATYPGHACYPPWLRLSDCHTPHCRPWYPFSPCTVFQILSKSFTVNSFWLKPTSCSTPAVNWARKGTAGTWCEASVNLFSISPLNHTR